MRLLQLIELENICQDCKPSSPPARTVAEFQAVIRRVMRTVLTPS